MIISWNVHTLPWENYFEYIIFKENIMSCSMKTIMKSGVELKILAGSSFQFSQLMQNAMFWWIFCAGGYLILFSACHSLVSVLTEYFRIWYCFCRTHSTLSFLDNFIPLLVKGQQEWFRRCLFRLSEWMPWQFIPAGGLCKWPVTESQSSWFYCLLFLLRFFSILLLSPSFLYLFSVMLSFLPCFSAAYQFLHPSVLNMSKRWDVK